MPLKKALNLILSFLIRKYFSISYLAFFLRYAMDVFNVFQIFLFNRRQILCLIFSILFRCFLYCLRMTDRTGILQHLFPYGL